MPFPIHEEPSSSIISAFKILLFGKIWCEDPIYQLSEMSANGVYSSDQHYLFLIIMAFSLCPSFMGTTNSSDLSSCKINTLFRSFCTHFVLILLFKHILLHSISFFRLLFKSIFFQNLKKINNFDSHCYQFFDHPLSLFYSKCWDNFITSLASCLEKSLPKKLHVHHCHWLIHSLWSLPDLSCRLNVSHWR